MWKIGRRLYLHARREGSLDIERNGEAALLRAMAAAAAAEGRALTIFDVGANYGQWSLTLLRALRDRRAPAAKLTQFEPVPSVRTALSKVMSAWSDTGHITIEPLALSDRLGTATMVVTDEGAGTHHLKSESHNFEGRSIDVAVTTIDHYIEQNPVGPIDFIKIDAEGADPDVIRGMERLLRNGGVEMVQFEYSIHFVRTRSYLMDIFEIGEANGYRVALLTPTHLEFHECWHPDLEHFYPAPMLLVRNGARTYLKACEARYLADNTRLARPLEQAERSEGESSVRA